MSGPTWISTEVQLPAEGVVVETKIHNWVDDRNYQKLKRVGRLWFFTDGNAYVHYTPTHWHEVTP